MKILSKKNIIAFVALIILSIVTFSGLSFLFADEDNGAQQKTVADATTPSEGKTIIDYIIDNSYNLEDGNDSTYHILEISSGGTAAAPSKSRLSDLVAEYDGTTQKSKNFETYVINGNKSSAQDKDMNTANSKPNIEYKCLYMKDSDANLIAAISKADLIYFSEDPNSLWSDTFDISEDVKNALSKFSSSDQKPMIFDNHALTLKIKKQTFDTFNSLISNTFFTEGYLHATFQWPDNGSGVKIDTAALMNLADVSATYTPISGKTQQSTWVNFEKTSTSTSGEASSTDASNVVSNTTVAKVLTITKGNVYTLTDKFKTDSLQYNGTNPVAFTKDDLDADGNVTATVSKVTDPFDTTVTPDTYIYDDIYMIQGRDAEHAVGSPVYEYGYAGSGIRPQAFKFETIDTSTNADALATTDYSKYDFVIIENSVNGVSISSESQIALKSAMMNNVHILYDSKLYTEQNVVVDDDELKAKNIAYVYDKVATPTHESRYDYIMITARAYMDVYATYPTAKSVKPIADIINAGNFRGISGFDSGDSSSVYTVLEIEPCYPINTDLAGALYKVADPNNDGDFIDAYKDYLQKKSLDFVTESRRGDVMGYQYKKDGFYYLRTSAVSDKTTDEISYDEGATSLTDLLDDLKNGGTQLDSLITQDNINNVVDYYNWNVSKAKIAHATNRSYNKIRVVHMSANEFATSRVPLLDNYDAIYIGGDTSAIKKEDYWYANNKMNFYRMYSHNGDMFNYSDSYNEKSGQYGVFSGNDLTDNKLKELKEYAAKMPVIIDTTLSQAYIEAEGTTYNQRMIDPESNMYSFLDYISTVDYSKKTITSNYPDTVLVNFDQTYTYKALNVESSLGTTYGNYATVFRGEDNPEDYVGSDADSTKRSCVDETDLTAVLNKNARPLFAVTSMPTIYSEDDPNTWIDISQGSYASKGLTWKISTSVPCKYRIYIDDNSDGKFTASGPNEIRAKQDTFSTSATLNVKLPSTYYGVVYWKVEVEAQNGLKSSTTNVCKVKRTTQPKMTINLLEIMPMPQNDSSRGSSSRENSGEVNNDIRTLYLCTDCQFNGSILKGTPFTDTGLYNDKTVGRVNTLSTVKMPNLTFESTDNIVSAIQVLDKDYKYQGSTLGVHKHDFGIVKYYDDLQLGKTKGWDDVSSNWFDLIRDDYEIEMTVMYSDDYETKINEVNSYFANQSAAWVDEKLNGSDGFLEKKNQYQKYYQAMRALINDKKYVTYNSKNGTYSVNFTALDDDYPMTPSFSSTLENMLVNSHVASSVSDADALIGRYAGASYQLDKVISDNKSTMITKCDTGATSDQFTELLNFITSDSVDRDDRKYSYVYSMYNAPSGKIPDAYTPYYCDYRDAMILERFFYDSYQENLLYSSYKPDTGRIDLHNTYDCLAIGAADYFNYGDIQDEGCRAIKDFADDNGTIILFHDSLNVKKTMTSNMSSDLSDTFGQNARHKLVAYSKTLNSPNVATISIDGHDLSTTADMGEGIQSRDITFIQKADKLKDEDKPFSVSVGGVETKINSTTKATDGSTINLDSKQFNITYEKTGVQKDVIELSLRLGNSGWEGNWIQEVPIQIDPSATKVTADVYCQCADPGATKKVDNIKMTGNDTSAHDITVELNFIACDDKGNPSTNTINWNGNGVRYYQNGNYVACSTGGAPFTISSTNVSSKKLTDYKYSLKELSCDTASVAANEMQKIIVSVVEGTTTLEGEEVSYIYKGNTTKSVTENHTDSNYALFNKESYAVTGYEVYKDADGNVLNTTTAIATSDGYTDNQTLNITILDANKQPIVGKGVTVVDGYNSTRQRTTNENGLASFVQKNYSEATAANPVEVSDGSGKNGKTYEISNKSTGLTYSSRMLTYKGYFQDADVGYSGYGSYDHYMIYKYSGMNYQSVSPTTSGGLVAQNSLQDIIADAGVAIPTDKTQKNNEGIVTKYPFGIGDRMQISATSPGDYAVDIQDDNLVVYYSMVGGTSGTSSSMYAADPMDGINNYFIYQYGSVYYTGAGYVLITGHGRNNNDERKLYINIIVNSGRKSTQGPSVSLFDKDSTDTDVANGNANNIIKEVGGEGFDYYMEIEDLSDFEGFDYLASISEGCADFSRVEIWYDIDHTSDISDGEYEYSTGDVYIFKSDKVVNDDRKYAVEGNKLKTIDKDTPNVEHIKLDENYFDPNTGKNYCYIVVKVWDASGEQDTVTLRLQYKPALIDLD